MDWLVSVLRGHQIPVWYSRRHIQGAQQSWTLSLMQRVDFTRSFDDGCRELLRMWEVEYVPAAQP